MIKKITILPQIKKIKSLTPTEKKVASEIARFTNQDKWFFKILDNFALELQIKKGTLKNVYVKFTKLGWLEKDRNGRIFEYRMTKQFFSFVENYELKNSQNFAHFSQETMTDKLPNNDRLMTDKLPNNDRLMINIPFPSSVQATNQSSNILNNECIKDLRDEREKENTVELEVQSKTPNSTQRLNINSLSVCELIGISKEDMANINPDTFKLINKLVSYFQRHEDKPNINQLKEALATVKEKDNTMANRLNSMNWGGWWRTYQASKAAESIKQFTITKIETPEVLTLENIAMSKYSKEFQTIVWITEREDKGDINSKEAILEFLNKDNEIPNYSKYEHLANQLFSKLQIKI